ncbi:MAG: C45 family autoproteolytic acyltransferase/hydrolase [Planctomycetota bacterium]|nr:C45 family autoproteolytic acyltransferase/hydrolase [Planctomycetota bacterium]MDA1214608.1 C45 family autoproteolytic acyltransferase/hydrolase [Planctomycetota bacterium]
MYPLYTVAGSARELGRQHGEQAAEKICRFLDFLASSLKRSSSQVAETALKFELLFQRDCPHLLDEIQGLSEGAGISFAEALALQLRGELGQLPEGGCTSFAIGPTGTANRELIIGQNSDNPPEMQECSYMLKLQPADCPEILMWTFGGMIGYHGLNAQGVAHFANSLGGGPKWKFALAHYPLKRLFLEQTTLDDVMRVMNSVPVCSNGNYMLCGHGGEFADVELTSDGPRRLPSPAEGFLVHANHYLCTEFACDENFRHSLPDSFSRQSRLEQLIRDKWGSITVEDVKTFLSDHDHHPLGICRHRHSGEVHAMLGPTGYTVASLIAEPSAGRIHVSAGNPCEEHYATYQFG